MLGLFTRPSLLYFKVKCDPHCKNSAEASIKKVVYTIILYSIFHFIVKKNIDKNSKICNILRHFKTYLNYKRL